MNRRVVITGLGVVSGLAHDIENFWTGLLEGRSGVGPIDLFDPAAFKVRFAGQVRDFQPDVLFGPKEARHLDRFVQFALAGGDQAVKDSGLDFASQQSDRCGVMIGSGIGGLNEFETQHRTMMERGPSRISPFTIPKLMVNAGSGHISIRYGLTGPASAIATACASAANAIGDAFRLIQSGITDVMITGGSEAALTHMGLGGFAAMRALSTRNDEPTKASRPFDKDRDGFVLSEGAGILVLEEASSAEKRGATIYGEVLGYGMSADGTHITAPDEMGRGAARAMVAALKDAQLDPSVIDYINAHGTSTPLGDLAETRAMKSVFGSHANKLQVSSTKSQLGHLLGASGGVEAVVCALAMQRGVLPPTINLDNPDPECDLDYIPHNPREAKIRYCMSNSFGFGGHNASLIFGQYKMSQGV
jgi:3-oxoacyl-[acyl-carrier-protein] synthase II